MVRPCANLECRSEMCCTQLAARWKCRMQKLAKNRHLGTIAQICWAIFLQLRHVLTIGKKLVKQQHLLHMLPQYGELQPTNGWDLFGSLGHPSYFQRLPRLDSVTARQSSSERQPNFVALNRGRHLCSAGWPSRWALAHILVGLFRSWPHWLYSQAFPDVPLLSEDHYHNHSAFR